MKKVLVLFLSMLLLLSGCGSKPAQQTGACTAGTYTATEKGYGGDVTVEVTVSENAIESVKITGDKETAGIGSLAVEKLGDRIVAAGSAEVDVIAGATFTSNAIIAATKAALESGCTDVSKLVVASGETEKESKTLEADLVVVGGGGTGLPAAIRATELGLNVVVLEKTAILGGAMATSMGYQVVSGSELQAQLGVTEDTPESMYNDFMANGANLNVPELLTLYTENVGATTDWLDDFVEYDLELGMPFLAEYEHKRALIYVGGGAGGAEDMANKLATTDATVLMETKATELIVKDGAVVGVKAEGADADYTINAKAVLLATGGYGANKELLGANMQSSLYYGPASSTGDGLLMAKAVNAATRLTEYGKHYPNGIEVSPGIAKSTLGGNNAAFALSGILVNKAGVRVVNEKSSNRTILEAQTAEEGSLLYLLMDAASFEAWRNGVPANGIDAESIDAWLANNGSTTPILAHAETIADVAAIVGMDAEALQATVDKYNGYVAAGVDEEFGRGADYLTTPIGEGPYYLVEQKPRFATTMGGVVINTDLQVINTDGDVIPGLYASGEVTGGVMGDDSPSGANNGWAVTSGKLAAESIAEALK